MSITVQIRDVFGRQTVYPVCATACTLAALAGRKTFTEHDLRLIRQLGYTVETQARTV